MGESLEYLESLYEAGDFEGLVNNGECLADWGISIESDTPISRKRKGKKARL